MAKKIPIDTQELAVKVLRQVDGMRRDRKHCDFLIKVGSEEIPVHRNILSATSDYFGAMFSHPTEENKSGVVEMMGVDPECAIICVDHMYGKEVSIFPDQYEPLMYVAKLMQLQKLPDAVLSLVESNLDPKSFYTARRIASMYGCQNLEEKCEEFAEEHFGLISKEEEFGQLEKSFIEKVIRSENVKISEDEKLCGLFKWTKYNSERSESLVRLVICVDLSKVSVEYRRYLMENEPLIAQNFELFRSFSISMLDTMNVEPRDAQVGATGDTNSAIVIFDRNSGYLQCFNPSDNSWKKMHEMNDDMKANYFDAVTFNIYIFVVMENKSVYRLRYFDETAAWETVASLIEDHGWCPPIVATHSCIYVVGGQHDVSTKTVEMYNPAINQWIKLEDKPKPSRKCAVLSRGGYIYSFGGILNGEHLNKVERFNPTFAAWTYLAPMNEAKRSSAAVALQKNIYVLGGCTDQPRRFDAVECYDIDANQWRSLSPMTVPRTLFKAYAINGEIFAVGGNDVKDSIEKYNVEEDEWKAVALPTGKKLSIKQSVIIELVQQKTAEPDLP